MTPSGRRLMGKTTLSHDRSRRSSSSCSCSKSSSRSRRVEGYVCGWVSGCVVVVVVVMMGGK